jgi:hypothetical protein
VIFGLLNEFIVISVYKKRERSKYCPKILFAISLVVKQKENAKD